MSRFAATITIVVTAVGVGFASRGATPAQQPVAASNPYTLSYAAGRREGGVFVGGTELNALTAFGGKLYAAVGYWMDRPALLKSGDPRSAAQVLVLDRKDGIWRAEKTFDRTTAGAYRFHRASAMQVLRFRRHDAKGAESGSVASLLAVVLDSPEGAVFTQAAPGRWDDTHAPTALGMRSLTVHYDAGSRQDMVFAGQGGGQDADIDHVVYTGTYDAGVPGRIRWGTTPEHVGTRSRIMSMVECGGPLFAAAKPSIFRRDDRTRTWRLVYSYPVTDQRDLGYGSSGFRALTCVDAPGGKQALLSGFESTQGDIMRIDPASGTATRELRTRAFLRARWGADTTRRDLIAGYSDIPQIARQPDTRVFGLLAISPAAGHENSAWFLSRTMPGTTPRYDLHEIPALPWPNRRSDTKLWSVRAMAVSPFPEDRGNVMYLGGYDGHFQPVHNTAWIYRADITQALAR